jgi:hypothetical protein
VLRIIMQTEYVVNRRVAFFAADGENASPRIEAVIRLKECSIVLWKSTAERLLEREKTVGRIGAMGVVAQG